MSQSNPPSSRLSNPEVDLNRPQDLARPDRLAESARFAVSSTSGSIDADRVGDEDVAAILVLADDDAELRAIYAPCLRAAGHQVIEAADGWEAVAIVRAERPSLLLLDIWMPGLNGFEVLDALRHDPSSAQLKVVILSNLGDADSRLEAFEAGASAYLVKGIALFDLVTEIDRLVEDTGLAIDPEESWN